MARGDD